MAKRQRETPPVFTADSEVAGCKKILKKLREFIMNGLSSYHFEKEVIIHGPPDTGKTSMVRAVVKELEGELTLIMPPLTMEILEKKMSKAYDLAAVGDRSIVFVDQLDMICPEIPSKLEKIVVNMLATIIDENNWKDNPIIIIAATNRYHGVHSAIRNSFKEAIEVSPPSSEERLSILEYYMKGLEKENGLDLKDISSSCKEFVGGDLLRLCNEALFEARRRASPSTDFVITKADFDKGKRRVLDIIKDGIVEEVPAVTWDQIGGLEDLKKIMIGYYAWAMQANASSSRSRAILLVGPSGCGKTMLTRAIAHHARASFFPLRGELLRNNTEGVELLRRTFRVARLSSPSFIFIDHIDTVFSNRCICGAGSLLGTFLSEVKFVMHSKEVLVVASTNRPSKLHPSISTSFKKLYVPPPDEEGRLAILTLKIAQKKLNVASDVDLKRIASMTAFKDGLELESIITVASNISGDGSVGMHHFTQAVHASKNSGCNVDCVKECLQFANED